MQRDDPFQILGQFRAVLRETATEGVAGRVVGVAQVVDAGQQRTELAAVADNPADRNPAEADPVIAALAPDQAGAAALADRPLVGERDLERGIDAFRTRIAEEDSVQPLRHQHGQPVCRFERTGVRKLEGRPEIELARGLAHRLDDRRAVVPGVDAPQSAGCIEHLVAGGGGVVHPIGRHEHARVRLEAAVIGERHPKVGQVIGLARAHHGSPKCSLARIAALAATRKGPIFGGLAARDPRSRLHFQENVPSGATLNHKTEDRS